MKKNTVLVSLRSRTEIKEMALSERGKFKKKNLGGETLGKRTVSFDDERGCAPDPLKQYDSISVVKNEP